MREFQARLMLVLFAMCLVSGVCHTPDVPLLERINVSHNPGNSTDPYAVVDSRDTVRLCSAGEERTT